MPILQQTAQTKSLIGWFVIFLSVWQTVFSIPANAMNLLLKFIHIFLTVIANHYAKNSIKVITESLPRSLFTLQKHLNIEQDNIIKYTVCPSCYSLYKIEDCFQEDDSGEKIPKRCNFISFPNHSQLNRRLPCKSSLLVKVNLPDGKIDYRPKYVYAYQPIKSSLQRLLNCQNIVKKLDQWRNRQTIVDTLSDIYDGQVWKDFLTEKYNNFLQTKRHLGVMLNVDFFQPFKHVTASYGVIYLAILNLPRSERLKKENILIIGIIPPFEHEPDSLNSFLKPMVDELKEFWNPGVRLYTAESPKFKLLFKVALMCVACDIPAARKCCGFKGHSANYGCSRCKKFFPGGIGCKDFSGFDRTTWPKRDLQEHREKCRDLQKCCTQTARELLQTQTGIKYSVLIELSYFDPIRFTIVDPMHNLFLGTAKHTMKNLWLENGVLSKAQMKILQTRIDTIRTPRGIGRIPNKIATSFNGFTAEQWKNWVILYSMFALRGIIPEQHYVCWQTFVLACFYLCRRSITNVDIIKADHLLIKFCKQVENLFGNSSITPNMHLHGHLADCIKDYGSVYGFWLFSFERLNGLLGSYPNNKRNIAIQLMKRFIYEAESFHYEVPSMFGEEFIALETFNKFIDPYLSDFPRLINNFNYDLIKLPSVVKTTGLSSEEIKNLKVVYNYIYGNSTTDEQMTKTLKIYKSISLYGQTFGSVKSRYSQRSTVIMATWAKDDGTIVETSDLRPGKVLYYLSHSIKINEKYVPHLFAAVAWFSRHSSRLGYGKPLEVWNNDFINDGPSLFLPIHMISSRCVTCKGRILLPPNTEENVLFISPLPSLYF